jgi:hypothetical protein
VTGQIVSLGLTAGVGRIVSLGLTAGVAMLAGCPAKTTFSEVGPGMTAPAEAKGLGSSPAWLGGLITGVLEATTPGTKGGPEAQAALTTPVRGLATPDPAVTTPDPAVTTPVSGAGTPLRAWTTPVPSAATPVPPAGTTPAGSLVQGPSAASSDGWSPLAARAPRWGELGWWGAGGGVDMGR